MRQWRFVVDGEPKGEPRVKAAARKIGDRIVARVYTPGTAESWKSFIAAAVKDAGLHGMLLSGPVKLRMRCFFTRPKSHYRTGRNAHMLKENAPEWHTAKPDADNVIKAAKDVMKAVGVYRDDSQVSSQSPSCAAASGSASGSP